MKLEVNLHKDVANIMFNELHITKESIEVTVKEVIESAVQKQIEKFLSNFELNKIIAEAVDRKLRDVTNTFGHSSVNEFIAKEVAKKLNVTIKG